MQFISPWRRGEVRSSFVATVIGEREARERIAAPKSLEPVLIFVRVRGTIDCSVVVRRAETRVEGVWGVNILQFL